MEWIMEYWFIGICLIVLGLFLLFAAFIRIAKGSYGLSLCLVLYGLGWIGLVGGKL